MSLVCIVCFGFFFKQKAAYEMRISDWSSDVCSSDLHGPVLDIGQEAVLLGAVEAMDFVDEKQRAAAGLTAVLRALEHLEQVGDSGKDGGQRLEFEVDQLGRESCRERVCHTSSSRWSPHH